MEKFNREIIAETGFDEDCACTECRLLWVEMAEKFKEMALKETMESRSMRLAMMADAAYWQATGITDGVSAKRFLLGDGND